MTDYRDPKVTTPKSHKSGMGKWIGIALAVLLAILLLFWILGETGEETVEGNPPVVTTEPAPPAGQTAPAPAPAPAPAD